MKVNLKINMEVHKWFWLILFLIRGKQGNISLYKLSKPFKLREGYVQWKLELHFGHKLAKLDACIKILEKFLDKDNFKLVLSHGQLRYTRDVLANIIRDRYNLEETLSIVGSFGFERHKRSLSSLVQGGLKFINRLVDFEPLKHLSDILLVTKDRNMHAVKSKERHKIETVLVTQMKRMNHKVKELEQYLNKTQIMSKFSLELVKFVENSYEIRKLIQEFNDEIIKVANTRKFPLKLFSIKEVSQKIRMINEELKAKQLRLEETNLFNIETMMALRNKTLIFFAFLPCVNEDKDAVQIIRFNKRFTMVKNEITRIYELERKANLLQKKTSKGYSMFAEITQFQEWNLRRNKKTNLVWKTIEDVCYSSILNKNNEELNKNCEIKESKEDLTLEVLTKNIYLVHTKKEKVGKMICETDSYALIIKEGSTKLVMENGCSLKIDDTIFQSPSFPPEDVYIQEILIQDFWVTSQQYEVTKIDILLFVFMIMLNVAWISFVFKEKLKKRILVIRNKMC